MKQKRALRILKFAAFAIVAMGVFGLIVMSLWNWLMPMLFGLGLVSVFIWIAENLGTVTRTWLYPHQVAGWSAVSLGKLGSWFLLLIISYALVAAVNRPEGLERSVK